MAFAARRLLNAAAILGLIGVAAVGCSRETSYEVLTFFFTGVPPLDAGDEVSEAEDAVTDTAALIAERQAEVQRRKRRQEERYLRWAHGPFAAEQCGACHALSGSLNLSAGPTRPTGPAPAIAATGSRLAMPREKLCQTCHAEKSLAAADAKDLRVHGPVAAGLCVICHSPHQSERRYMLHGDSNFALCTQCHDAEGLRQRTPVHAEDPDAECTVCHNPHMGRTAMILRSEYDERKAF